MILVWITAIRYRNPGMHRLFWFVRRYVKRSYKGQAGYDASPESSSGWCGAGGGLVFRLNGAECMLPGLLKKCLHHNSSERERA